MKKLLCMTAAFVALSAGTAQAIEITVLPSLAPNVYGNTADFNQWNANAIYALTHGLTSYGTPGTPGYYEATPNIRSDQLIVTNYTSWGGEVNPSGAYAGQHGTRGHFTFMVDGEGGLVSLDKLSFNAVSTDTYLGNPYNGLGFGFGDGAFNYSQYYVGIQYGADNAFGGGDDTYITGGPNTQTVNLIVGRGPGNAWDASCGVGAFPPCATDAERQAVLDGVARFPGHDYQFTGTFDYEGITGSGTFNVAAVPEPSTWALMILGFGGAGAMLRNRRSKVALA